MVDGPRGAGSSQGQYGLDPVAQHSPSTKNNSSIVGVISGSGNSGTQYPLLAPPSAVQPLQVPLPTAARLQNNPLPANQSVSPPNPSLPLRTMSLASTLYEILQEYKRAQERFDAFHASKEEVMESLDRVHDLLRTAKGLLGNQELAASPTGIRHAQYFSDLETGIKSFTHFFNAQSRLIFDTDGNLGRIRHPSPNSQDAAKIRTYLEALLSAAAAYMQSAERLRLLNFIDLARGYALKSKEFLDETQKYTTGFKYRETIKARESFEAALSSLQQRIEVTANQRQPPALVALERFNAKPNSSVSLPAPKIDRLIRSYVSQENFNPTIPPLYAGADFDVPYQAVPTAPIPPKTTLTPEEKVGIMAKLIAASFDGFYLGTLWTPFRFTAPFGLFSTEQRYAYLEAKDLSWAFWIQEDEPDALNVIVGNGADKEFSNFFANSKKHDDLQPKFKSMLDQAAQSGLTIGALLPQTVHVTYGRAYSQYKLEGDAYVLQPLAKDSRGFVETIYHPSLFPPTEAPRLKTKQTDDKPPFSVMTEHPLYRVEFLARALEELIEVAADASAAGNKKTAAEALTELPLVLDKMASLFIHMHGETRQKFGTSLTGAIRAARTLGRRAETAKTVLPKVAAHPAARIKSIQRLLKGPYQVLSDQINGLRGIEDFYKQVVAEQLKYFIENPSRLLESVALKSVAANLESRDYLRALEKYEKTGLLPHTVRTEALAHLGKIKQKLFHVRWQLHFSIGAHQGNTQDTLRDQILLNETWLKQVDREIAECSHLSSGWLKERIQNATRLFIGLRESTASIAKAEMDFSTVVSTPNAPAALRTPPPLNNVAYVPPKASHGGMGIGKNSMGGIGMGLPFGGLTAGGQTYLPDPNDPSADDGDTYDQVGYDDPFAMKDEFREIESPAHRLTPSNLLMMPLVRFEKSGNLAHAVRLNLRSSAATLSPLSRTKRRSAWNRRHAWGSRPARHRAGIRRLQAGRQRLARQSRVTRSLTRLR